MCSGPKQPFAMCVSRARVKPWEEGMHSVLATRSLDLELVFQSLSSITAKSVALCDAFLRSEGVDPALRPNRCLTMGSKKMSPANWISKGLVTGCSLHSPTYSGNSGRIPVGIPDSGWIPVGFRLGFRIPGGFRWDSGFITVFNCYNVFVSTTA